MMQLPTGGGKTIIAGALLWEWLKGGRKAVWLTHRKELATQTCELLKNASVSANVDADWNPGDDAPARRNGLSILMAQTVSRRTARMDVWRNYGRDDLMIVDEAHHAAAVGWTRAMRQWPGRILGMTATPWRLSVKEGFDHLFSALLCGPQVVDLQSSDHLCGAQVRRPSSEWIIHGGAVGMDGDFTESGIVEANQIDVMTAGAFKFWQEHAYDRQTIMYAVSVNHAYNLAAVFAGTGVPAAVMLGETKDEERASLIAAFKKGNLKVLVNVAVATEGFDLPDASCVVITRPTKSLTLYLQMVGRGLRPKEDNGNCLILDLAANSEFHGLPADEREWSLEPREVQEGEGDALTIWCDRCKTLSPAASHNCQNCGAPFGKDCGRCGRWRAWKRWRLEKHCGEAHDLVCDLCHRDAHIEASLAIDDQLEISLDELEDEEVEMSSLSDVELDGENEMLEMLKEEYHPGLVEDFTYWQDREELQRSTLEGELGSDLAKHFDQLLLFRLLKGILEEERLKVVGADEQRQHELRKAIEEREAHLVDDAQLSILFEEFTSNLPANQRPQSKPQEHRMFSEWENGLRRETNEWKNELARLDNQPVDKSLVFNRANERVVALLRRAAQDVNLLPDAKNGAAQMASQTRRRGKRSGRGRSTANDRPYGANKSTATHPEQFKELALRLHNEGNNARQVAEELFAYDFGTRSGRMIGPGQMAQMLNRWTAEPNQGMRNLAGGHPASGAAHEKTQAKARAHGLRDQGLTMGKIAGVLNNEGYRTVQGLPYTQQNVWHLLNRDK